MIDKTMLARHSLFGGLSPEQMDDIGSYLREDRHPAGVDILTEGASNNRIFFIIEGSVVVKKHSGCKSPEMEAGEADEMAEESGDEVDLSAPEQELIRLHTGDAFGEMELIDIQPCAASVTTLEDTTLLSLSNRDLYQLSKEHPEIFTMVIMNLAREISRRLRRMDAMLASTRQK